MGTDDHLWASDPKGWNPGFLSGPQFAHLSNGGGNDDPCVSGFLRDAVSDARQAPQADWGVHALCKDGLQGPGSRASLEGLKLKGGRSYAKRDCFLNFSTFLRPSASKEAWWPLFFKVSNIKLCPPPAAISLAPPLLSLVST